MIQYAAHGRTARGRSQFCPMAWIMLPNGGARCLFNGGPCKTHPSAIIILKPLTLGTSIQFKQFKHSSNGNQHSEDQQTKLDTAIFIKTTWMYSVKQNGRKMNQNGLVEFIPLKSNLSFSSFSIALLPLLCFHRLHVPKSLFLHGWFAATIAVIPVNWDFCIETKLFKWPDKVRSDR